MQPNANVQPSGLSGGVGATAKSKDLPRPPNCRPISALSAMPRAARALADFIKAKEPIGMPPPHGESTQKQTFSAAITKGRHGAGSGLSAFGWAARKAAYPLSTSLQPFLRQRGPVYRRNLDPLQIGLYFSTSGRLRVHKCRRFDMGRADLSGVIRGRGYSSFF